jgi:phosphoserine phosphatase
MITPIPEDSLPSEGVTHTEQVYGNLAAGWWERPHAHWRLTLVRGLETLEWNPNAERYRHWKLPDAMTLKATLEHIFQQWHVQHFLIEQPILTDQQVVVVTFTLPTPQFFQQLYPFLLQQWEGLKVDVCLQPDACTGVPQQKQLWLSDMDSTLLQGECIDELAEYVGLKGQVAQITAQAMRGEIPFEQALNDRVALLKGLPTQTIETVLNQTPLMPGAMELARGMSRAEGWVVSGGFEPFTERLCAQLELQGHQANVLESENGYFTGRVLPPIRGSEAKRNMLLNLCQARGLPLDATLTLGDGANDLPMLLEAGLGIAFHAKPAVEKQARHCIRFNDLRVVLYYQGIFN